MNKSMKRALASLLIISLLISFVPNLELKSIADGTPTVTMNFSGTSDTVKEAAVGDTVSVDFGLANGVENKTGVNLVIRYDNTKLRPLYGYESDGSTQFYIESDLGNVAFCIQTSNSTISFTIAETRTGKGGVPRYVATDGTFNTLDFEVIGAGETSITVDSLSFIDQNNPEELTFSSGSKVTVKQAAEPVTTLELDKTTVSMKSGETATVKATKVGNSTAEITWKTVPASGQATLTPVMAADGKSSTVTISPTITDGNFTLQAWLGTESASCTVNVSNEIPLTGITLSETSLSLNPGANKTLTVTNVPNNTTDTVNYEWSINSANATLSATTGRTITVTAVNNGEATVTVKPIVNGVTKDSMEKTCTISIHTPATGLRLDYETKTIDINSPSDYNNTVQLHAAKLPDGQGGEVATDDTNTITWESSNPSAATVSDDGLVTPIGKGTTLITAKINNTTISATCEVKVVVHVQGIEIQNDQIVNENSEKKLNILKGQSADLSIAFTPDETEISEEVNKTIEWSVPSTDAEYVSINNGTVTAIKGGRDVRVTASIPGTTLSDSVLVHVEEVKADTLAFNKTSTTIAMTKDDETKGNEEELYVYLLNSTDSRPLTDALEANKVSISSSNSDITVIKGTTKTVDGKEVLTINVTASKPGNADITATYEGLTTEPATLRVTATRALELINIVDKDTNSSIDEDLEVELSDDVEFGLVLEPADATVDTSAIVWTSNSEEVASIDNTGKVTLHKTGTATITARLGDKTDFVKIKVVALTDQITIENTDLDVYKGKTLTLTAKASSSGYPDVVPTDVPSQIKWTSSDNTKVTVDDNGVVTGVGNDGDTAEITVEYTFEGGRKVSTTATVTVKEVKADSVTVVEKPETMYVNQDNQASLEITVPGTESTTDPVIVEIEKEDGTKISPDENGIFKNPETNEPLMEIKVSEDGKKLTLTGKKVGKYTVGVSVSGKTDSFEVTVKENPIQSIKATPKQSNIEEGKTTTIDVTYVAEDRNAPTTDSTQYTYESTNKSVATVDENGKIKALKAGKTTITVSTDKGIKDTFELTVKEKTQETTGGGSGGGSNNSGNGSTTKDTTTSNKPLPHTGDINVAKYLIIAVISLAGMIIAIKKK